MVAETAEQLQLLRDKQPLEAAAGLETARARRRRAARVRALPVRARDRRDVLPAEGHVNPLIAAPLFALRAAERGRRDRTHARRGRRADASARLHRAHRRGDVRRRSGSSTPPAPGRRAAPDGLPMRREGLHVNVTEPRAAAARADDPAHRPPADAQAGRQRHVHHRRRLAARAEAPPARCATTLGERRRATRRSRSTSCPRCADVRLLRTWSGVIAFTDDVSPIVGESRACPGFYTIVVGSTGYTLSPLFARMLAEQIDRAATAAVPDWT